MQLPYSNIADGTALEQLILSCVEPVERMASRYCGQLSRYEDFVSIGMLEVCEAAAQAHAKAADPLAYLCRAAQNAMFAEHNRLHRAVVLSLDMPLMDDGFSLADIIPDCPPVASVPSKRVRALNGALRRLPSRQRAAVRRLNGLTGYGPHSRAEAARALHTPSNHAAHMLDFRGRRNLSADARLRKVLGVEELEAAR